MSFNERSQMQGLVVTLGAGREYDDTGLLLHKCKDGGAQWIYLYILHGRCREMGLGALGKCSFRKVRELATQ